jgi:hypothetical protein
MLLAHVASDRRVSEGGQRDGVRVMGIVGLTDDGQFGPWAELTSGPSSPVVVLSSHPPSQDADDEDPSVRAVHQQAGGVLG